MQQPVVHVSGRKLDLITMTSDLLPLQVLGMYCCSNIWVQYYHQINFEDGDLDILILKYYHELHEL